MIGTPEAQFEEATQGEGLSQLLTVVSGNYGWARSGRRSSGKCGSEELTDGR
ncbi:hypothetical protein Jiend_50500 [Micromonospora endophytica]|nr:hypothetical protein Jiend_50500 [Micromonospora endophytica]